MSTRSWKASAADSESRHRSDLARAYQRQRCLQTVQARNPFDGHGKRLVSVSPVRDREAGDSMAGAGGSRLCERRGHRCLRDVYVMSALSTEPLAVASG